MVKKAALTLGALALAFGGAALVAPAAHADSSVQIAGAKVAFLSDATSDAESFRLYDTACDGSRVYLMYKHDGDSPIRHYFGEACGKSRTYVKFFPEGSKVEYRACVDPKSGNDRCSIWKTDRA